MSLASYILGIFSALLTVTVVLEMLRRRRMRERHALWWLLLGAMALVVSIFPRILEKVASLVGVAIPVNLVFFVSAFILFLVCLQHSSELTVLEDKTRTLAEASAMQDLRIAQLEAQFDLSNGPSNAHEAMGLETISNQKDKRNAVVHTGGEHSGGQSLGI